MAVTTNPRITGVSPFTYSATGITVPTGSTIGWSDLFLGREAAAILQMGNDVNGAAVAQTFKAHDGITGTDVAGANLTLAGGRGTGAGAVGNLLFATSTLLGSGTTAQTLTTRVTITGTTITTTLPLLAPDGTAAAPSYSFSSDSNSGFFGGATLSDGYLGYSVNGTAQFLFGPSTFRLGAAVTVGFSSNNDPVLAAPDVILGRDSGALSITTGDVASGATLTKHIATATIAGGVTDGYTAGIRLTPTYSAATAQTVTRHNYIDLNAVTLSGAGPAALTDAAVFRFDAAAGTHKATVGATTKTTPGAVDAWVKINMNGTLLYIPAYVSTTA